MEPGFENEVFTFLFINTDNTMRYVEYATLLIAGQINKADIDMYGSYNKGDIANKEVTVSFNAYPITSSKIDEYAQSCLNYLVADGKGNATDADGNKIGIAINSMEYDYTKSARAIEDLYNNQWASNKSNVDYYAPGSSGTVTKLDDKLNQATADVPIAAKEININ